MIHKPLPKLIGAEMPVVLDVRVVSGTGGGPDKTILNSPRYLNRAGYRMLCAYLHPPEDPGFAAIRTQAERRSAPLLSVPDHGPLDYQVVPRLIAMCRENRVRVWHGHDYKSNLLGLLVNAVWPMRLVTTVHGWVQHTRRTPIYYGIDRLCLRYYEAVWCVSPDLYQVCRRNGVPGHRCELLENGIDLEEYERKQTIEQAKRTLGLDPRRPLIGAVGRLSPEKGFDLLIRATAQLRQRGLDVDLAIVGEGSEQARLQALAVELGCRANIRLVGYQAEPARWFEAMDIYALSSLREGLPNVLLEAMALRVPVVATKVAGTPRLIESEVNGLLIEPGETSPLTNAMDRLLTAPELRSRFQEAGRRTVEQRFSFAKRMERVGRLYDRLLGRALPND